jgi:molybdopterin-guanine dinucleotide biosynthesis protein A
VNSTAIVLTGGKSSRMGRPKALLTFGGEPLITHIARALGGLFTELIIVAAPEQELPPLAGTLVRDELPFQGPVGGIYYGLRAATTDFAFVTSCDAPFLNLSLISFLTAQISPYDVVVPFWQDRFQPLHAVYRKSVLPLLKEQLEQGNLRPISLYGKVRTLEVHEDQIRRFDPEGLSFLNMNTPADYQAVLARWEKLTETEETCIQGSKPIRREETRRQGETQVTVELFGVARLLTKAGTVPLSLSNEATLSQVYAALADEYPVLVGRVITPDKHSLTSGYACNINGLDFVRTGSVKVNSGDKIFLISADAGG